MRCSCSPPSASSPDFLGGTKVKFKAPLGRVINFKFQKSSFFWWFWCYYHFVFLLVRLQFGGHWGQAWVIRSSSPPPLSLDYDRIWVASFHLKAFTSVFKNSLIKSQFVLISSQFSTMEKFLENEMRWLGRKRRGKEEKDERHKACEFYSFQSLAGGQPWIQKILLCYGRVRVGPGELGDLKIYYKLVEKTHHHFSSLQ